MLSTLVICLTLLTLTTAGAARSPVERTVASAELVQGHDVHYWARRSMRNGRLARQQEKNSVARGRTVRRLKAVVGQKFIPSYWVAVASCESGVNWTYNGSSGFDGAVQFHPGTWRANRLRGYPAFAYLASPFQQLVVAEIVLAASGWGQWPACSKKLGLR